MGWSKRVIYVLGRNRTVAHDGGSSGATPNGRQALLAAKKKIRELFTETVGDE